MSSAMYGNLIYSDAFYADPPAIVIVEEDDIRFVSIDGSTLFSLQGATATTRMNTVDNIMQVDRFQQKRINKDGIKYFDSELNRKTITINGIFKNTSPEDLKTQIDNFKRIVMPRNADGRVNDLFLDIKNTGDTEYRRYRGVVTNLNNIFTREHFNNIWMKYDITFEANDAGEDIDNTNQTFINETTLSTLFDSISVVSDDITFPTITITINSASGITALFLEQETFPGSFQRITMTRTFSTSEEIILNFREITATADGTFIDAVGKWFPFFSGTNKILVEFTGTSIDYDILISYKGTYL